ncbi:hypothetical protein PBY51_011100 [Eleginops maclovinus]|uniref:HEAT repeat-containing protein 4 n=1 Tax=Eleginops maclovinus TaxID=56733 RepID=A0AAN8AJX3_ELEMC|nr:hypothetical protein PBY51_011100 [Eleginops maclovinus]
MDSCYCSKVSASGSMQLQRSQRICQQLITDAAAGLSFSPDALEDPTTDKASYNQADFHQLFKPSGALKPSPKRKTKERSLCRPAPRPPVRVRDFLPVVKSEDQAVLQQQTVDILQDSRSRTRLTDKPVHHATHRNQDQICLNKLFKYQKLTSSELIATHPDRKILKTDLSVPEDPEVQTAISNSCPSTAVSRPPSPADPAGPDVDGWLAAQCAAPDGDQHLRVIQRLLAQLCTTDQQEEPDPPIEAQLVVPLLIFLLARRSTLVRSLLAEQLNSLEWTIRLMSCNTLCSLTINKDVMHKLLHVMLSDHRTVRHAAADTLMKLGKIHQVHTELRLKLEEGQGVPGRKEALDIICHLKIKTATLQEPVVRCLGDKLTALRKQACQTAASMLLKEDTVVSRLLQLVENDTAAEVRLSAIRAVGALGLSSPDVQETLMHCVETEEEAELRAEACRMLQSSGVSSYQLQDFLLQRLHSECDLLVCRTMRELLELCDCSQLENFHYTQYISKEVKRLCDWRVITGKLLLLEKLRAEERDISPRKLARRLSQQIKFNEADDRC